MLDRLRAVLAGASAVREKIASAMPSAPRARLPLIALGVAGAVVYTLYRHPPLRGVQPGELALRVNQFTGSIHEKRDGTMLVVPALHTLRTYSLRDQLFRPEEISRAAGAAPLQSVEGLSFGVDLTVRYALDADKLAAHWQSLGDKHGSEVIEPAVLGTIYKTFARYTVREIFSSKRTEIQSAIEKELAAKLAADGVLLRAVHIGKVDLPPDYRRGMDALLAEELASEKMRYTLALKEKRVKETALDSEAEKVRGERLDHVQVYDYRRERGGFVRAQNLKRLQGGADEAPELLAVLRYLRDTPGSEALAIGLAGAFIQAAPASVMQGEAGIAVLDVMGTVAERLARRASAGVGVARGTETALSAHLDVAARYGLKLISLERGGRMQLCYDGAVFQRILTLRSTPEQRARAALALTRSDCIDPELRAPERARLDQWRADVLDKVDTATLPGYVKNRVHMRRASVWSALAYSRARHGEAASAIESAASRALSEIAGVNKLELPDEDHSAYNDTAMRVSAVRWAAVPAAAAAPAEPAAGVEARPSIITEARQPGETCVLLIDAKHGAKNPLATRCTYGLVWARSATLNREGTALALAVQPLDAWRELWVFRKAGNAWGVGVLPPAPTNPEIGYAEFAGWVPGGKHMLLAREARGEGKYKRNFELLRLDTLTRERQAGDPSILASFQRWQDPLWKKTTLSMR